MECGGRGGSLATCMMVIPDNLPLRLSSITTTYFAFPFCITGHKVGARMEHFTSFTATSRRCCQVWRWRTKPDTPANICLSDVRLKQNSHRPQSAFPRLFAPKRGFHRRMVYFSSSRSLTGESCCRSLCHCSTLCQDEGRRTGHATTEGAVARVLLQLTAMPLPPSRWRYSPSRTRGGEGQ